MATTKKQTKKTPAKTRKKVTTEITEEPEVEQEEELDPFDLALSEFGSESEIKLTVYRYDEDERPAYIKKVSFDPEHHTLDWIRKKWGHGTYLLRFHILGDRLRTKSKTVTIAPDAPSFNPPSYPQPAPGDDRMTTFLQRQNEILLGGIVKGAGGSGMGGGSDPVLLKFIEGSQAMNATLMNLAMQKSDISGTLFNVFERGLELAGNLKVDEGAGGWVGAIKALAKELGPALGPAFQEMAKQRATMPRPITVPRRESAALPGGAPPQHEPMTPAEMLAGGATPPPAETPPPETPPPPSSAQEPDNLDPEKLIEIMLRARAPLLLTALERGESTQDIADYILGETPPNYYDLLEEVTAQRLVGIEPRFEQHKEKLEQITAAIRDGIHEGDTSE